MVELAVLEHAVSVFAWLVLSVAANMLAGKLLADWVNAAPDP